MTDTAVQVLSRAEVPIPSKAVAEFGVKDVKARVKAMHDLMKEVMQDGVHYGTIPGTPKPTLYKPGAEKIGLLFQLAPSFGHEIIREGEHFTVITECTLTHMPTGVVVAHGSGLCTSKESKYAFRQATRKCPKCGKAAIIKGKEEYGGGWLCFAKKGGCGAKWPDKAQEIESQSESQEENPNLADTFNTILKMADKRAYVAATLFGTAASDIYTQDVEDFSEVEPPPPKKPDQASGLRKAMKATLKTQSEPVVPTTPVSGILDELNQASAQGYEALARLWKLRAQEWKARFADEDFDLIEAHKDDLKASLDQQPEIR